MIGRKNEFEKLQLAMNKDRAQLIAVYGRRRVGKTFLINEFFEGKFLFKHTAVSPVDDTTKKRKKNILKLQLQEFYYSMRTYGLDSSEQVPTSWQEAFYMLEQLLEKKDDGNRQVIFIDELPWMDTPKANFMPAFEHFCNDWCLARRNFKMVVCGSTTSWILDKLINNKGGLYGRVTLPIYLSPFTLYECREFFKADGLHFDEFDICQAYIAFGGIPFYLDQFQKGLSLAQNIDAILYDTNAPLKEEFDRLFTSQFSRPDELKRIVTTLATKRIGFTRDELVKRGQFSSGGTLTENLAALQKSRLIMEYIPFGESTARYKLTDPFCVFYLKHVRGNTDNPAYWQTHEKSLSVISWMGFAFEDLCWTHIRQIKHALGIEGVISVENMKMLYDTGALFDFMTVFPLAIAIMFVMLQDRRRPLWPIALTMAPIVVGMSVCTATRSDAIPMAFYVYYLLLIVGLIIYMVRATRQYGRWLRDNYADLEHKEVWQSLVVLAIILLSCIIYAFELQDMFIQYMAQMNEVVLVCFLVWRTETISDLSSPQPLFLDTNEESDTEGMTDADLSTTTQDKIGLLLQRHCIDTHIYLQHDLTIHQLATTVGTNRYYLSLYFSRQGTTYNAYINGLRIDHFISLYRQAVAAKEHFTVRSLAQDSGYHNYTTFSNAFKQRMGKNVTAWMQEVI